VGGVPECFAINDPDIRMNWITAVNIPLTASYFGIGLILPSAPGFPNSQFGFPTSGLYAFVVVNLRDMPSLIINAWSYYLDSRKYLQKRTKISLSVTVKFRD
jgi:hypothetical protein